jgi:flagellar biosynthetic protein FliP
MMAAAPNIPVSTMPRMRPLRARPLCGPPAVLLAVLLAVAALSGTAGAQETDTGLPLLQLNMAPAEDPGQVAVVLEIFLLLTVLSLAPGILVMVTSFTRILIVLSLLRRALGTMQMPPNQVLIGLALFLTFFIMTPVWQAINQEALQPYLEKKMAPAAAIEAASQPLRDFMLRQTREKDLALFVELARIERPKRPADIPITVLIPAFIISEVKTAFQIGLLIFVPFLVVDMVVASVLLSMGMMMLPPIMISLPFKLMLFVLADGWFLIVGSLVRSFV